MYVKDLLPDLVEVLGSCDLATVFRRLTDATKRMGNKGIMDPSISEIDICACDGLITLPNDVGTILAVNVGGHPTLVRGEYFHFHINGPGDNECHPCSMTDELGMHCTIRDPSAPVYLVAELDSALDNNKQVRLFGWDIDNKRIWTPDANGTMRDGFLVPTIYGNPTRSSIAPPINRIDRIQKDVTAGFVKLIAVDQNTLQGHTLIGYYQPNETDPQYRRIRVARHAWARIKYRKANPEVTSINDWIPINNREALMQFVKAVKYDLLDRHDVAASAEAVGVALMNDEATAKRPKNELTGPEIAYTNWPAEPAGGLFY